MDLQQSYNWRRQLLWGLVFIGIGAAVLFDRIEMVDIDELWHYWPLLMVVIGINKMVGYPTAKHFADGLWTAFTGAWIWACFEHLYGMTFRTSWPVLLIGWGVVIVLKPLIESRATPNSEQKQ
jgi:hypothetical protein